MYYSSQRKEKEILPPCDDDMARFPSLHPFFICLCMAPLYLCCTSDECMTCFIVARVTAQPFLRAFPPLPPPSPQTYIYSFCKSKGPYFRRCNAIHNNVASDRGSTARTRACIGINFALMAPLGHFSGSRTALFRYTLAVHVPNQSSLEYRYEDGQTLCLIL